MSANSFVPGLYSNIYQSPAHAQNVSTANKNILYEQLDDATKEHVNSIQCELSSQKLASEEIGQKTIENIDRVAETCQLLLRKQDTYLGIIQQYVRNAIALKKEYMFLLRTTESLARTADRVVPPSGGMESAGPQWNMQGGITLPSKFFTDLIHKFSERITEYRKIINSITKYIETNNAMRIYTPAMLKETLESHMTSIFSVAASVAAIHEKTVDLQKKFLVIYRQKYGTLPQESTLFVDPYEQKPNASKSLGLSDQFQDTKWNQSWGQQIPANPLINAYGTYPTNSSMNPSLYSCNPMQLGFSNNCPTPDSNRPFATQNPNTTQIPFSPSTGVAQNSFPFTGIRMPSFSTNTQPLSTPTNNPTQSPFAANTTFGTTQNPSSSSSITNTTFGTTQNPPLSSSITNTTFGTTQSPFAVNNTSSAIQSPFAVNNTSGTTQSPFAANNTSGTTQSPFAVNNTSSTTQSPFAANNTSGTTQSPFSFYSKQGQPTFNTTTIGTQSSLGFSNTKK